MNFLTNVEKLLDLPPAKKSQVIRELKSHYYEIEKELASSGKSPDQIENEIQQRLGSPKDIAARMNAVHNSASWKSAIIAIVPFLVMLTSLNKPNRNINISIYAIFFLILLAGSVRELILGRRPIWLATWLAGAYYYCSVFQKNIMVYSPGEAFRLTRIINSIIGFILILILVYGASKVKRWRTSNILLGISQIILSLFLMNFSLSNTSMFLRLLLAIAQITLPTIIIVRFALAVFGMHHYGSASQALLFIFANAILGFHMIINSLSSRNTLSVYNLVGIMAISIAFVCYIRMSEWKYKLLVVAISIILICVFELNVLYRPYNGIGSMLLFYVIPIFIRVAVLVIYEHLRRKKSRDVLESIIST